MAVGGVEMFSGGKDFYTPLECVENVCNPLSNV